MKRIEAADYRSCRSLSPSFEQALAWAGKPLACCLLLAAVLAGSACSSSRIEPEARQEAPSSTASLLSFRPLYERLVQTDRFTTPAREAEPPESPLDYFSHLEELDSAATDAERYRLEYRLSELESEAECSIYCTKLALLLSVSASKDEGQERSISLLERALAAAAEEPIQERFQLFASLWQQKLQSQLQIESLTGKLSEQTRTIESLQKQLEELTALEQQLMNREGLQEP
ncbi:MAG TPA: hypothetical protein GX696_00670 [Pseudomonadaceae bacterium]|nr:hypothetical protein [Pseudomonadaceae bacterium]